MTELQRPFEDDPHARGTPGPLEDVDQDVEPVMTAPTEFGPDEHGAVGPTDSALDLADDEPP